MNMSEKIHNKHEDKSKKSIQLEEERVNVLRKKADKVRGNYRGSFHWSPRKKEKMVTLPKNVNNR